MNNDWQRFIEAHSGVIAPEDYTRFPGAPREAACALMELSHLD